MRYSGDWMSLVDDRILEYVHEHESGSPKEIMEEGKVRYSRQHIARRCRKLEEEGLLRQLGNAVYVITEDGEAYLEGRLDTQDWTCVDESNEQVNGPDSPTSPEESDSGA
jgi:repressor of nif and glnA expression